MSAPKKGLADRPGQDLGAIDDEETTDLGIEAALNLVVHKRLHGRRVFGGPFDHAKRVLVPFNVNACGADHQQLVGHMEPVDPDHQKVELRQIRSHPLGQPRLRQRLETPGDGDVSVAGCH